MNTKDYKEGGKRRKGEEAIRRQAIGYRNAEPGTLNLEPVTSNMQH
jgi:hypothetical protein